MRTVSSKIIVQAIEDLHDKGQLATRETLAEVTGLPLRDIDNRLAYLVDIQEIFRVQRGVFIPARRHAPDRIITKTLLGDGTVKIEIGDDVLTLTPRENRMLGELMAGAAQQFVAIELGKQVTAIAGDHAELLRDLRRDVTKLQACPAAKNSRRKKA